MLSFTVPATQYYAREKHPAISHWHFKSNKKICDCPEKVFKNIKVNYKLLSDSELQQHRDLLSGRLSAVKA